MLNRAVRESIEKSVLCWLATTDGNGQPNVSPKKLFTVSDDYRLLIADVSSQQTVKNLFENRLVCASFIDIFKEKGFKLKGRARLINSNTPEFEQKKTPLLRMSGGRFEINHIIEVEVCSVAPILAPSYVLFPETTEQMQIDKAMARYGVRALD